MFEFINKILGFNSSNPLFDKIIESVSSERWSCDVSTYSFHGESTTITFKDNKTNFTISCYKKEYEIDGDHISSGHTEYFSSESTLTKKEVKQLFKKIAHQWKNTVSVKLHEQQKKAFKKQYL